MTGIHCHNPSTMPADTPDAFSLTVDDVIDVLVENSHCISGITLSGGEPTQQIDFILSLFGEMKKHEKLSHLTTLVDSNGVTPTRNWFEAILFRPNYFLTSS